MELDFENFNDLTAGISTKWIADYLHVNLKTVQRWKEGTTDAPHAIRLLLRLKIEGDLSALGGENWKGFVLDYKDHLLYTPGFRAGHSPEQLQANFFLLQDARHDKRELKKLSLNDHDRRLHYGQAANESEKNNVLPIRKNNETEISKSSI